jgi:hypothetical protein
MSDAIQITKDLFKKVSSISPQISFIKETEPVDEKINPLGHLEALTNCCPDAKNREKVEDYVREKNILNDFVLSIVNSYPEHLRSQILEEVNKSMASSQI